MLYIRADLSVYLYAYLYLYENCINRKRLMVAFPYGLDFDFKCLLATWYHYLDSNDPRIDVDLTSTPRFRVGSMSTRRRFGGLCYPGTVATMIASVATDRLGSG